MSGINVLERLGSVKQFFGGAKRAREKNPVDPINAALWALASFDRACGVLAELRQLMQARAEEDPIRVSADRIVGQYIEAQCREFLRINGVDLVQAHKEIDESIGAADLAEAAFFTVGTTHDPLALEVLTYAMYLGTFTAHGKAPWHRLSNVMKDHFYDKHPLKRKVAA